LHSPKNLNSRRKGSGAYFLEGSTNSKLVVGWDKKDFIAEEKNSKKKGRGADTGDAMRTRDLSPRKNQTNWLIR